MVVTSAQLSVIEEIIEKNPGLLEDAAALVELIAKETYGRPATQEEIDRQLERLLLESVAPGRTIDIAPFVSVGEGETVDLNGTVIATVLANQGTIIDSEGRFGDNLFAGVIFNSGDIDLDPGEDFIIGLGGGISNGFGTISTGGQLDLVSGIDLGNNDVEGVNNFEGLIDLGNGNDRLVGNAVGIIDAVGVENIFGVIDTGRGNDLIDGEAAAINLAFGIENIDFGLITTGQGNDLVLGVADDFLDFVDFGFMAGILNDFDSVIDTGANNDKVEGFAIVDNADSIGGTVYGVANLVSEISLGGGNDLLVGEAFTSGEQEETAGIASEGFNPTDRALVDLGSGDDFVFGFAEGLSLFTNGIELKNSDLVSKSGNNLIEGEAIGGIVTSGIFVDSSSKIKLGGGNDIVAGFAFDGFESNEGITNRGTISLGAGDDVIESLFGDFGGEGTTNLGRGNDVIAGFGTGNFNGGAGTDIIKLTTGVYRFDNNTLTREEDGVSMGLRRVEGLSGLNDEESLLLVDGATYIVNEDNSALFF